MNIFVLEKEPHLAAQYHCDSHVGKMLIESCQMLCTAHRILDNNDDPGLYKLTHQNHPCSKWVRESVDNYIWLLQLAQALADEFYFRRNKYHLTERKMLLAYQFDLYETPKNIPRDVGLTPFAQAMPDEYKNENAVVAYRKYYRHAKSDILRYNWGREAPAWLMEI